ncbi:hypothetical protein DINM_021348 [Dirofilaria immitis]|nr:hypothetical protein [Dirofilaria immitis]
MHVLTVSYISLIAWPHKTVIENRSSAFVYRSLEIGDGKPILQDLELDATGDYIYALTPKKVVKIKVRQCGVAGDCSNCLAQRDPYCGWCVLNNACVPESECTKSIPSTAHDWLTYRNGRCPAISRVEPDKVQRTNALYLDIELENLPNLGGQLTCVFDFGTLLGSLSTLAQPNGGLDNRIRCPTPSGLPEIPLDAYSLVARLAVSNSIEGPPLAYTNFTFYDCSRFKMCSACVSSPFPCDWCIESNQCVAGSTTENRCRSQQLINGVERSRPSSRKGPSHCPRIIAAEKDFFVASGKNRQISVVVENARKFMTDFKWIREWYCHCKFFGDLVLRRTPWGFALDNNQGIRIVMYKCESLASNCGLCLVLSDEKYDCGWCPAEKQCTREENCLVTSKVDYWLDRSELCPYPVITNFSPKRDLSLLIIDGVNLGHSYKTVEEAVTAANVRCDVDEHSYVTASRIVCRTRQSPTPIPASYPVVIKLREEHKYTAISNDSFTYVDPVVKNMEPTKGPRFGGTNVTIWGENLDAGTSVNISLNGIRCTVLNRTNYKVECRTGPSEVLADGRKHPTADEPLLLHYGFELDGVRTEDISQLSGFRMRHLTVFPDPVVEKFSDVRFYRSGDYLTINGKYLDAAARERDIVVTVGGEPCNLTALANRALTCQPPPERPITQKFSYDTDPDVLVKIGDVSYRVGYLSYSMKGAGLSPHLMGAILIPTIDQIEMKVATECKEAFAELQTSMNAMAAVLPLGTPFIPFLSYKEYIARVLFPNNYHSHPVLRDLEVDSQRAHSIEMGLRAFNKLLMNKHFLLSFVRVMENNKYFLGKDRVSVGSLLMVVLMPKILFRRSESVAERMLAAWYTILMYRYLTDIIKPKTSSRKWNFFKTLTFAQECAGGKLYELYWAMKQQMEKGPQDALTLEARYSLSEEKLLRASFDFRKLTVFIVADHHSSGSMDYPVRVLDCDSITQVKEKCLDAKYRTTAFSDRPSVNDLDLELRSACPRVILQDIDSTSKIEPGGWKRINTLAHYNVPENATLALLPRQASLYNLSILSERSTFSLPKQSPILTRPSGTNSSSQCKVIPSCAPFEHGSSDQQDKMVTEIYLTRQNLLEVIFSTTTPNSAIPCVKYMFDFMDDQAREHGIEENEVVHAWKSNSLPLRFWVNLIKNPHFVFDIQKPTKLEGCLSVVAQTLMDACSTQEHQLTKDSPSSKLLFAKDIYQYRDWVDRYLEQYKESLREELDMNQFAVNQKLPQKFQDMLNIMECIGEYYSNGGSGTIGSFGHRVYRGRPREDRV